MTETKDSTKPPATGKPPRKSKKPKMYLREERVDKVPVSRSKHDIFLIEKSRDLDDYVKETTEVERESDEEMETDHEDSDIDIVGPSNLEDSDQDDLEEEVREAEEEIE